MFITVLICTHKRADSLRLTLESILTPTNLKASDWEVIVVHSGEPIAQLSVELSHKFPAHFRCLVQKEKGKSNALNTGIASAKGDILAMTDDDVLCAPDYLQGIRAVFSQHAADGAQGRILLDCEGGRPEWFDPYFAAFMSERDYGDQTVPWNDNLAGTNMVVRTEAARRVGGYRPELGAGAVGFSEDSEFSQRMREAGCRLIYAPQILVRHQLPQTRLTKSFFKERFFRIGCSQAYLEALPLPLWRFGLYALKEMLFKETEAFWHRIRGRPALALRRQCEARSELGFFWQQWRMSR